MNNDIQEVNWGNFKAKFNGKEQVTFQWLSYLLFCEEYSQPLGISRYENHAGIETDPVKVGNEVIGWQAKYYENELSKHKDELITSIDTAKTRHPGLTHIVFYLNQDFGQHKKTTDPKYKLDVEAHANSKGVSIIWKGAWFFESPFVIKTHSVIAKHFFNSDKSIIDLIQELSDHSSLVLNTIQSEIHFAGKELKIDRSGITTALSQGLSDNVPVILSGEGGVGKTAVIKDLYSSVADKSPLFVFKAIQFNNTTDTDSLVKSYGDFKLSDLAGAYPDVTEKCIVIDSAEKLSDIEDKEVFNVFVTTFLQHKWKLIFTTRHSYLDDLRNMLVSLYGIAFHTQNIEKINHTELVNLSYTCGFTLPDDERLQDLICNPFYLNEYLQNYDDIKKGFTYSDFKNTLWNRKIANSSFTKDRTHVRREECFIALAQRRADEGNFFVKADGLELPILQKLIDDEIVGYEEDSRGYFITHDIYEEWALERFIESTFRLCGESETFYKDIGNSLPIRRAFRHWLIDKLMVDKNAVKSLVETSISNIAIESHWRDEVLVSVLLSDHSKELLELFEAKLLENDAELLIKITFLLRIACKEIDENTLKSFGVRRVTGISIQTLFTMPKGSGWNYIIDFINRKKDLLGLKNINIILAVLADWNSKFKQGETTRAASQIALFYYESVAEHGGFGYGRSRDELGKKVIKVILDGSREIKGELSDIVDAIVSGGKVGRRDKYYELAEVMLSSVVDSAEVAQAIPEKILALAEVYWMRDVDQDDPYGSHSIETEQYFGLAFHLQEYFPPSPYQTPLLILLRTDSDKTLDFILSFVNKTTEYYKKSSLSQNEVQEVEIVADDNNPRTQYISCRLWEMYRATHVAPGVLESIHMALEKWLLEIAPSLSAEELEKKCINLFKNSKSASITSVIVSIILAHPFKLFNVAAMIFRTKDFFLCDTTRYVKDQSHKSMLLSLKDNFPKRDYIAEIFEEERIKACDDEHRKSTLENVALYYQLFKNKDESDEQASHRQRIIWGIFDEYYKKLPDSSTESSSDKTWRLYLARMDRRKMQPKVENKDGKALISFNPDLDKDLKKYSEDSLKKNENAQAFLPLDIWAKFRWRRDESKYKEYRQFEENPANALKELKKLLQILKAGNEDMALFYRATAVYVCGVLVRDFKDKLSSKDFILCEKILIEHASRPIKDDYRYSIGDGIEASIGSLPYLYANSENKPKIKKLLLFLLFDDFPIGMGGDRLKDFPATIILHFFWKEYFDDAHSLFLGFLILKPKYEELIEEVRKENFKKNVYEHTKKQVFELIEKRYGKEIDRVITNAITYTEIPSIETIDLDILNTAFELLPPETQKKDHLEFLKIALPLFAEKLKDEERNGYVLSHNFLRKLAYFVLKAKPEDIDGYIKPFAENFSDFEYAADLFSEFVSVEDEIHQYEQFWIVWELFYKAVVAMAQEKWQRHNANTIIHNYLLAWQYWKETAKKWESLKDREKVFFKKVTEDMGNHPAVLYSISKLLNEIGSSFIDDGIVWLSSMLEKNKNLKTEDLEVNTVYYMENLVRGYAFHKRTEIKTNQELKKKMITILDFLIEKASVTAYLIREDIL